LESASKRRIKRVSLKPRHLEQVIIKVSRQNGSTAPIIATNRKSKSDDLEPRVNRDQSESLELILSVCLLQKFISLWVNKESAILKVHLSVLQ
jgi:hypothetical protein